MEKFNFELKQKDWQSLEEDMNIKKVLLWLFLVNYLLFLHVIAFYISLE